MQTTTSEFGCPTISWKVSVTSWITTPSFPTDSDRIDESMKPQKTIPSGRGADLKLGASLFSTKSVQNFEIDFGVSGFPGRKLKWWPCKQGLQHLQVGPQGRWSNLWRIPQYHPWFICHCDTHTMCEISHLDPNNNTQIRTKGHQCATFTCPQKRIEDLRPFQLRCCAIQVRTLRKPGHVDTFYKFEILTTTLIICQIQENNCAILLIDCTNVWLCQLGLQNTSRSLLTSHASARIL